ncbi:ferritin-like domain-containing protein [Enhygromyxa salina]|nr:ferritin-like domain-containing protein [Enhygromyxa salina]
MLDSGALTRMETRRARLEWALLAAIASWGSACAPPNIPDEDGAEQGSDSEDEGISPGDLFPEPDPEICFAQIDAAGSGDCITVLGYRWAVGGCESVKGCACVGADCDLLFADREVCREAYFHCALCDPCPDDMTCTVHCGGVGYITDWYCAEGGSCWPDEMEYPCNYEHEGQRIGADLECSGLGRAIFAAGFEDPSPQPTPKTMPDPALVAASAWARIAACEAASADVFEALANHLDALAAPAPFADDARSFASDERRHAHLAWAIARTRNPAVVMPTIPPTSSPTSVAQLVEHTIQGGCVGETLSALELEHMAAACSDPAIASTLATIAEDEARHAEHAWMLLAWLLRRYPELRPLAAATFARASDPIRLDVDIDLDAHGLLKDGKRAQLWALGRRRVVDRLAAQLLVQPPSKTPPVDVLGCTA